MTEQLEGQQLLTLLPRAESLAKLRALHNKAVTASATVGGTPEPATEIGQKMRDGSIFAGLTADGKQQIYAMPTDLDMTMTFNNAAKRVEELNADKSLGHDDWQIPSLENLLVLQKNQDEGALKGTFKTAASSGSAFPDWYLSSTENPGYSSIVSNVRFSDAGQDWGPKDYFRLSCRPVRLVAQAPSLG